MSANLKDDLLPKLRARYQQRGRAGKTRMLDELCEDHGYERKYAIKLLRETVPAPSGRAHPGPAPRYALIEPVVRTIWLAAERPCGNAVHASCWERNLVRFIKQLRKDFDAPNAKFVLATLGEATKGIGGNEGMVLEAQLAVDGDSGKHPEFKGNVATVFSNPLSHGGSGNSHYGGNAETYMDVGEAMGKHMAGFLK